MNISLLQLIFKLFSLFVLSFATNFNAFNLSKEMINVSNLDKEKSSKVVTTIVKYDTVIEYNSKLPSNTRHVLVNGEDGLVYQDVNGLVIKTLKEKVDEIIEIGTGRLGEYTGVLTMYGPDCDTCDGVGSVACAVDGKAYNLITDGITYNDKEFGNVRILAAPLVEFPCGSIVEINNSDLSGTIGIVLDTGGALINAYNNGNILFDLANETEQSLTLGTNRNTQFTVRRWGW